MRRDLIIIIITILFLNLPFVNQPFGIDDVSNLSMAEHIIQDPLHPHRYNYPFLGKLRPGKDALVGPLLLLYFMAFVIKLAGGTSAILFHLVFIVFPIIIGISFYFLSKRFSRHPLLATLLLVGTPAIMLMSHNIFAYIPPFAFFILTATVYIYGSDRNNKALLAISAISILVSIASSYQCFYLLPLLGLYSWSKRQLSLRTLLPLLFPSILFVLVLGFLSRSILAAAKFPGGEEYFSIYKIFLKTTAILSFVGGAFVFPLCLLLPPILKKRNAFLYGLAILLSISVLFAHRIDASGYKIQQGIFLLFFLSVGIFTVFSMSKLDKALSQAARREETFLHLWFLGVLLYNIFFMPHGEVKYLLQLAPPLTLLVIRRAERISRQTGFRVFVATGIVLTMITGISCSLADYEFYSVYPRASQEVSETYPEARIWFAGEWGLQYYLNREGHNYLFYDSTDLRNGDIVVTADVALVLRDIADRLNPSLLKRLQFIKAITYWGKIPIRTVSWDAHAGFYCSALGLLPYSFSNVPLEHLNIYMVGDENYFIRKARESRPQDALEKASVFKIDKINRVVLLQHPPAMISFKVQIPEDAYLSFALALDPAVWDPAKGDGVQFNILTEYNLQSGSADTEEIFSKYIDPKNNPEDRRWHDECVDLSRFSGKNVTLIFETTPGAKSDASWDHAGWAEPRIITGRRRKQAATKLSDLR